MPNVRIVRPRLGDGSYGGWRVVEGEAELRTVSQVDGVPVLYNYRCTPCGRHLALSATNDVGVTHACEISVDYADTIDGRVRQLGHD